MNYQGAEHHIKKAGPLGPEEEPYGQRAEFNGDGYPWSRLFLGEVWFKAEKEELVGKGAELCVGTGIFGN